MSLIGLVGSLPSTLSAAVQQSAAQAVISQYELAFQVSPIILQGGIAANAQGGVLPIVALYGQAGLFSVTTDPTQFFAQYLPLPGSTLISNAVSVYPFANQQVAGNAIIQQPLTISMLMICPVNQPGGYVTKLATFTALQNSLQQHCAAGGTFSIATPAFIYNTCILVNMASLGTPEGHQQMIEYQLDFVQPLITLTAAAAAQQALIAKVTSGGQITGVPSWSGSLAGAATATTGLTGALAQFGGVFNDPGGMYGSASYGVNPNGTAAG